MSDDEPKLILLPGVDQMMLDPHPADQEDGLGTVPPHLLEVVLEGVLFSSERPLTLNELDVALGGPGPEAVLEGLDYLQERYGGRDGGIRLVEVAKGWQLRTDVRAGPWVSAFRGGKPVRLSKAALEALAVVSYRQPVTRGDVEDLRGVDCGGVLRMLVERQLVMVAGRKDEPGRPLLYCTTPQFLELFGLRDLSELPTLRDLRELQRDDSRPLGPAEEPSPPAE